jgi:hypothetical protein
MLDNMRRRSSPPVHASDTRYTPPSAVAGEQPGDRGRLVPRGASSGRDRHGCRAVPIHSECVRAPGADIDDSPGSVRTSVAHLDCRSPAVLEVCHMSRRSERQALAGCRVRDRVEPRAVRHPPPAKPLRVDGCDSPLDVIRRFAARRWPAVSRCQVPLTVCMCGGVLCPSVGITGPPKAGYGKQSSQRA